MWCRAYPEVPASARDAGGHTAEPCCSRAGGRSPSHRDPTWAQGGYVVTVLVGLTLAALGVAVGGAWIADAAEWKSSRYEPASATRTYLRCFVGVLLMAGGVACGVVALLSLVVPS